MAATLAVSAEQARNLTDRIKVAVDGTWLLIQEAYTSRAWAALGYASWDDYCTREFGTSRLRLPREERQEVVASLREIGMSVRAIASATGQGYGTVRRELSGEPFGSPDDREIAGVPNRTPDEADEDVRLLALAQRREAADTGARVSLGDLLRESGIDPDDLDDGDTDEVRPVHFGPVPDPELQSAPRSITGTDGKQYSPAARSAVPQRPPLPPQFGQAALALSRAVARVEQLQADDRFRANRQAISDQCVPEVRRAVQVLRGLLSDLGHDNGGPS